MAIPKRKDLDDVFSFLINKDLKASLIDGAEFMDVSLGEYIRGVLAAHAKAKLKYVPKKKK